MSDVTVGYRHIGEESKFVSEEESNLIAVQHFEIDGYWIPSSCATLSNDGPGLILTIQVPDEDYPYLEKARDDIEQLKASLTPYDWLEETTDDCLVLPVARIKWAELVGV